MHARRQRKKGTMPTLYNDFRQVFNNNNNSRSTEHAALGATHAKKNIQLNMRSEKM